MQNLPMNPFEEFDDLPFVPYARQIDAVPYLSKGNGILAWGMGVGKTYGLLLPLRASGMKANLIVPRSIARQWHRKIAEVLPRADVQIMEPSDDQVSQSADVVIATYNGITQKDKLFAGLLSRKNVLTICDEIQYLANSDAMRTKRIYGTKDPRHRALRYTSEAIWGGSGGIAPNNVAEVWPHYAALFPRALGPRTLSYDQFVARYCETVEDPHGGPGARRIIGSAAAARELGEAMKPFMWHIKLRDVVDLPPLTSDTLGIEISAADRERLKALHRTDAELRALLANCRSHEEMLEILNAAENPNKAALRRIIGMMKVDGLAEWARDDIRISGSKRLLIFAWHRDVVTALANKISDLLKTPIARIVGGMSPDARDAATEAFISGKSPVLVANMAAGGVGLDGLQVCNRVVFAEGDWTPKNLEQAIARLERDGQKNPIFAFFTTIPGTLDEIVQKSSARKAKGLNYFDQGLAQT